MTASKLNTCSSDNRDIPLVFTRNIGIVAHIDAGKTTTTERILFYTGVVHKIGEVHEGTAITDWMEQEQERGITITSAAITCNWVTKSGIFKNQKQRINIIDTPGHVDFTAEVERSLRVLDGAISVFCAVAGVQPQSETVWRQMDKYTVPRMAFINKMDRPGANFLSTIEDIRIKLKGNAHPLCLPIGEGENFSGIIDLATMKAHTYINSNKSGVDVDVAEIPRDLMKISNQWRENLIEAVSDFDDNIAKKYLEGEVVTEDELKKGIRIATLSHNFIGAIPGSAFKNKGVQVLLDAIIDYLPSPIDIPPIIIKDKKDNDRKEPLQILTNDNEPLVGLVFKLMTDPYVGKLIFFRIYRGMLRKGSVLYNPRTRKMERVSRLMVMKANTREDINIAHSGDICAIIGVKYAMTGDTLCDKNLNVSLEPPTFPEPVISMSIEPNTKADQDKLSVGLQRLSEEDPTFRVVSNAETGETIISGMGELHLEIIKDRLFREFNIDAESGRPQIAYRETIINEATGEGKYIRQSGGRGQYGHAVIKIKPVDQAEDIEIINEIVGGAIPREFIKPTKEGILTAAKSGVIAGYPVIKFSVRIIDGSFHDVDSSEMAFKMAGIFAFKDAMKKANPVLLEPIMKVEVVTPDVCQGDIMGDLNRRRGQIHSIDSKNNYIIIHAKVPLERMFGYATDVRSLSKGRASYAMEPSHFDQMPAVLVNKIIKSSPSHSN